MRAYQTIEDALKLGTGVERTFHCGSEDHDDRNASASVNSITGAFLCYSCGWRGKVDVDSFEVDVTEAGRMITQVLDVLEGEERTLSESWLSQFDASGPGEYWLSRFTPETCRRFRLGVDYVSGDATFPVRRTNGSIIGIGRRNLSGEGPKYKYPRDTKVTDSLFAYEMCTDDVIVLTEGATDAMAAWEVGHQGMAVYGANLSRAQKDALTRYWPKAILLAFDMDAAGDRAAEEVQRAFPELLCVRASWDNYKDLASMPIDLRKQVLDAEREDINEILAQSRSTVVVSEACESPRSLKSKNSSRQYAISVRRATPRLRLRLAPSSPSLA